MKDNIKNFPKKSLFAIYEENRKFKAIRIKDRKDAEKRLASINSNFMLILARNSEEACEYARSLYYEDLIFSPKED